LIKHVLAEDFTLVTVNARIFGAAARISQEDSRS
jgi:hypothetical protein